MYTDEDLFNTTHYYDHDYKCKEPKLFKNLISELESNYAPDDLLDIYVKNGGTLDDKCFMRQLGDGAHNIAWIGKSIVIGDKLNLLKQLVELDSGFINSGDHQYCLLSLAIELERLEIVDFLLEKGANPNTYGHMGKTPLYYAIKSSNIEIVSRLLSLGADSNKTYGMLQCNYLYFALNWYTTTNNLDIIIIIKLLLEAGAKIQTDLLTQEQLNLLKSLFF